MTIKKRARRDAQQLWSFCLVNGLLDQDRVRQVVQQVVEEGYRDYPAILAHLLLLMRLYLARHTANVESATPLPEDLRAAIASSLKRMYGPELTTAFSERPSLIGGVRIQVGSDVYDGSLLAGLAALEKSF